MLDTNIYVSALALPGGRADQALGLAAEGRYELLISPAILAELANVLVGKFRWDHDRVIEGCRTMMEMAIVVRPRVAIAVFHDEPDNRVLECALAGQGEMIVTGDRHILKLCQYQGIRMVSLAEFLTERMVPVLTVDNMKIRSVI